MTVKGSALQKNHTPIMSGPYLRTYIRDWTRVGYREMTVKGSALHKNHNPIMPGPYLGTYIGDSTRVIERWQ